MKSETPLRDQFLAIMLANANRRPRMRDDRLQSLTNRIAKLRLRGPEHERVLRERMTSDQIDPVKAMVVHAITDGGKTKGWLHTHGLAEFGFPELEIRSVPLFLMAHAMGLLNHVAGYMLNGDNPIRVGEIMQTNEYCTFRFEELPPLHASHDEERWTLTDAPMVSHCEA